MNRFFAFALMQFIAATATVAGAAENPLEVWAAGYRYASARGHPPVSVTAYLKHSGDRHLLAFRLTNLSKEPIALFPYELPWGNPHSITLAAVATDGRFFPNHYPISDPAFENPITIDPGSSLEGDYDIGSIVELAAARTNKDIIVMWSYEIPGAKGQPICTGAVVISKR
jgi:hypothetical protein